METKTVNLTNVGKLLMVISQIKNPSFVRILNYSNDKGGGEVANYTINLGISYGNAKESDGEFLSNPKNIEGIEFDKMLELARFEMLTAIKNPKQSTINRSEAQTEAYIQVCPNIKVHKDSGRVFIEGLSVNKEIIVKGEYKHVNSSALTLAKKKIQKLLKAPNYRYFAFDKLDTVKVKGETIEITIG